MLRSLFVLNTTCQSEAGVLTCKLAAFQNVLASILSVMGLTVAEVNDSDTLSRLGIDSMQLVEVRPSPPFPILS